MRDLQNIVVPKVADNCYELGIQLFSEQHLPKLNEICTAYSNDLRRGCIKMLEYWLKTTPGATWDDLISALKAPGLVLLSIADDVEKEVKG